MKHGLPHRQRLVATTLVVLLAVGSTPALTRAAEPNTLADAERRDGWTLLFDGKSLAGWHVFKRTGEAKSGWHAAGDGTLVCPKSNGRPNGSGGDLVTDAKFADFEFTFEWRIAAGGNSGVQYFFDEGRRPTGKPLYKGDTGDSPIGFEYQVLDDATYPDANHGSLRRTGAIYDLFATGKARPEAVGQWNQSRIVVRGDHVEHWLNGVKSAQCDKGSPAYKRALAASKYHVIKDFAAKGPTALALQDHGEEVAYRNLKVREIHGK